ncbi:unnamed protein product [Lactuca virosa]|uniref:Uncharacterized protein n=1 Tax=Lactuca virosa TaxID=75947 RepID=A0AAU9LHP3_9ASTR|nr:unnamed protein product [Lactuca virosa]
MNHFHRQRLCGTGIIGTKTRNLEICNICLYVFGSTDEIKMRLEKGLTVARAPKMNHDGGRMRDRRRNHHIYTFNRAKKSTFTRISNKNTVSDVAPSSSFARIISSLYGESFLSAYRFLIKFKGVKSLCIELLSSGLRAVDNRLLKWKVKFGNRIESIIFLFPNSISDKDGLYLNGNGDEDENKRRRIPYQCLKDVTARHMMMLYLVKDLPLLEEVSVTDSRGRGRLSLSGKKLSEVKEWVHSTSETVFNRVEVPDIVNNCYIPVLKLPVSGYVMKGIYFGVIEMNGFQGGNDGLMNSEDGFEDKEEAAYTEAMMEILEKHKGMMHRFM